MANHYFNSQPDGAAKSHTVRASFWAHDFAFTTAAGTFAKDRLDKATAVLLKHVAPPASGTVLDLGCGWGPIACGLAVSGATTWAVDVNERALELTRQNADALGVSVEARLPDDVPDDLVFDQIWSNPPIRIGKAALHELLLHWLPRMAPDGEAFLVVGKNLGSDSLQRWLIEQGWPTERLASEKGFRVLRVSRA